MGDISTHKSGGEISSDQPWDLDERRADIVKWISRPAITDVANIPGSDPQTDVTRDVLGQPTAEVPMIFVDFDPDTNTLRPIDKLVQSREQV